MPKNAKSTSIRSTRSRVSHMHQFHGARNVIITGGSFRQVQGDSYEGGKDLGLEILRQHIAADAIFNSAERFPPAKCHPGTRERIISTIKDWISDPETEQRALWLYGPAGAGKSAIAHSIAVLLQDAETDDNYAASFFFARDVLGRGEGIKLFTTIAYQIALKFPSVRSLIDATMINDPTLPTKSIDVQLHSLITEPLLRATKWPSHNPTVIIDGLDECSGSKHLQSEILSLISKAINEHHIPLKFLIVSRPEYWISDSFEIGVLAGLTKRLSLRDDMDADKEIEKYLREGFDDIYNKNIDIMCSVEHPWPPEHIIDRFVRESSGQFVYPSTVLKFVGDSSNFCNPQEQLHILTTAGPHRASAFTNIDKLYASILSAYPRISTLKLVLGGILLNLSPKTIQEFLGVQAAEFQLVLRALSSLIKISTTEYDEAYRVLEPVFGSPLVESEISFCHLSFREFLEDECRSGRYAINTNFILEQLLRAILDHGTDILQNGSEAYQTIARIGINAYRRILKKFYLKWGRCQNYVALEGLLHKFNSTFQAHLANSTYVSYAQPELVYWFTETMSDIFSDFRKSWKSDNLVVYRRNKDMICSLDDGIRMIRKLSLKQLLGMPFQHTATFTYLASYHGGYFKYHRISNIMDTMAVGLPTILSDLQSHRNLLYLGYGDTDRSQTIRIYIAHDDLLSSVIWHIEDVDAQSQHVIEWSRRRTQFIAQSLHEIFLDDDTNSLQLSWGVSIEDFVGLSSTLLDINSQEWFNDHDKTKIFNILMDTSLWDNVDEETPMELSLDGICWFNRQLTGTSRRVIEEYDSSLSQRMIATMRWFFENKILPQLTSPYCTNLRMYNDKDKGRCIELHPMPPSDECSSLCTQIELKLEHSVDTDLPEGLTYYFVAKYHIPRFNDEVMNWEEGHSIISPAEWYPHLTSFLLTMLVKKQYSWSHGEFEDDWKNVSEKIFIPLVEYFPYAYPTQHNLNALRALHYLSPRTRKWRPPFGFCSQVMEFLKKYDQSLLSSHESGLLQDWLLDLSLRESHRILLNNKHILFHDAEDDETGEDLESTTNDDM